MVYIDLNMVRAGVVKHPKNWPFGGYRYILEPPKRYRLTNKFFIENVKELLGFRAKWREVGQSVKARY
jgi:putative transposase